MINLILDFYVMPFPNEHSCRLIPSTKADKDTIRRITRGKLGIIFGKVDGVIKNLSFRYPKNDWTEEVARRHCSANKGRFEPALKE